MKVLVTGGAGIFACNCDAPTNEPDYVTHNVACCISPEELARRIREAKIEGAKEALNEVYEMIVDRHISGGRAVTLLEEAMRRGEWPKETP